ncbi:nucleotide disphospho-sugar-binding domain-containing protein [Streptomyces sp. NPDC006645]|uniref:nucleotide disphospho-sugar-binding domain-containing protein n=1 Tax=unclassified Streptomyces TaxID=2593676 RepID=UPI0033BE1C21
MRILFIARGNPASIFGLVPLATSARNAGHVVLMTSTETMTPVVASVGLPGVGVSPFTEDHFGEHDRFGGPLTFPAQGAREQRLFAGGWYGRLAASSLDRLFELADDWRPDLVVGGRLDYAAPILATRLGVPFVRQAVDMGEWSEVDEGAAEELRVELKDAGLDGFPAPDLPIEIYPPSLRPQNASPATLMRWRPGGGQREVKRWMYTAGPRPRVCVTPGSRATPENHLAYVRYLAEAVGALDVELVLAVPDSMADALRADFPGAHVGWTPLDVVAPTCDAIVHHAGGMTSLTSLDAALPQLILPEEDATFELGQRVADFGAALNIARSAASADVVRDACAELLGQPRYRERAGLLAAEIARLTPPPAVVPALEALVR